MSLYVMLEKMPDSPEERKQLIAKHFEYEEYLDSLHLTHIQRKVIEFLLSSKGYCTEDIEANCEFPVKLNDLNFTASADMIIKIEDKRLIFVKCATNSLDSWERFSIAFCRAVDSYQIPYALITNGETAKLLNTIDNSLIEGGIELIPSRDEAGQIMLETTFQSCPAERKEKEKRIIYAFEGIKCPIRNSL